MLCGQSILPSQTTKATSAEKQERMTSSAAKIMMDAAKSGKNTKRDAATSPIREPNTDMFVDSMIPAERMDPSQKCLENYFKPGDAHNSKKRSI